MEERPTEEAGRRVGFPDAAAAARRPVADVGTVALAACHLHTRSKSLFLSFVCVIRQDTNKKCLFCF